jgi:hypothetical protein
MGMLKMEASLVVWGWQTFSLRVSVGGGQADGFP